MSASEKLKPGYVYSVAMASSGEMESFTPDCTCPCHLADAPCPSSWYCDKCWAGIMCWTTVDKPRVGYTHEQAIADGMANPHQPMRNVADYYFVMKGNSLSDELNEHFDTREKADARADELNELDVIRSRGLTKKQIIRARRLHEFQGDCWWMEGPFPWIQKLKKYAIENWCDDGTSWDTFATLAQVEKELQDQDATRVVDLDTGEEISFAREVTVTLSSDCGLG